MICRIRFGQPTQVVDVVKEIQKGFTITDDEWHVIENLFESDRIEWADEALFLEDLGTVVSLALICKLYPFIISYYTVPALRGNGYGFQILNACIARIREVHPDAPICIEPTNDSVLMHISRLFVDRGMKFRVM